jgi:hypothetical protein
MTTARMLVRPLALLLAVAATVPAALASDVTVKNDALSDGSTVAVQMGFAPNEIGAGVLDTAPANYPLKLKELQVFIGKCPSVANNNLNVKLYVWATSTISGGSPTLAQAVYTSPTLAFTAGGFNTWNVEASNLVMNGAFTVGCQVINPVNALCLEIFQLGYTPNLVTDSNGCQAGKNWVRQTNGQWLNLCSAGVSGDVAVRAIGITDSGAGSFVSLGGGLAGNFAPELSGSGSLAANGAFTLSFTNLPPGTSGPLFVGFSLLGAPFKGGTMLPTPDVIISLSTGPGSLSIPASMPAGLPSSFSIYLQAWFPDAGAPKGACATNGEQLITP